MGNSCAHGWCGPCLTPFLLLLLNPEDLSLYGYEPIDSQHRREAAAAASVAVVSVAAPNLQNDKNGAGVTSSGGADTRQVTAPIPTPGKATVLTDCRSAGLHLKYDLREEIGIGSTSTCYRVVRKADQKEFACKVIDKREVEAKFSGLLDQFNVEMKILGLLRHPNIIKLEDSYETSECVYMILEMMKGGELFDYVVEKGTLSEEEASVIVRKITSAVAHMHGQNIIHRDLKPENLLLTVKGPDAEVKLIDFGLAKIMNETVARSFLGTKGYLAPEMLQRNAYDKAVDIWALGVIVFVLLCGCLPFDDDSSRIATESAARKKFTLRFPRWATNLSASAKDLLHNLLDVDPKTRFTAEMALEHAWVSGRSVQPNNYLQSPSLLGERRKREKKRDGLEGIQEEQTTKGLVRKSSL